MRILVSFLLLAYSCLLLAIPENHQVFKIKLAQNSSFGVNTDWDELFFKGLGSVAVAEDGCFFAVPTGKHFVYKFDKNGVLIKKFGRKGRGPGDLYYPKVLPVIGKKHLLIADYGMNRKISVFTQGGKFLKVIKTPVPLFKCLALSNNCLAFSRKRTTDKSKIEEVFLLDLKSMKLKKLTEFVLRSNFKPGIGKSGIIFTAGDYELSCSLHRTLDGNLLLGFTGSNKVSIYSSGGKLLNKVSLNLKRIEITQDMKENFYKKMIGKKWPQSLIKDLYNANVLPEYAPYYKRLIVDDEDKLLIFDFNGKTGATNRTLLVYSIEGNYLGVGTINFGYFKPEDYAKMVLKNRCLYGIFISNRDLDDESYQFLKIKLLE